MLKNAARNSLKFIVSALCLPFILVADNAWAFTGSSWDPQGTSGGAPTSGNWEDISWSTSSTEAAQSPTVAFVENEAACFAIGDASGTNTQLTITMNSGHNVAGVFNGPLNPASCILTINGPGIMTITPAGLQGFDTGGATPGVTTINAVIAGPANLTPEGAGSLFLNGTNTYTGGTTLGFNATGGSFPGTLNFNNNASFGTGTITVSNCGGCKIVCTSSSAVTIHNSVSWQQPSAIVNFVGDEVGVNFSGAWSLLNTAIMSAGTTTDNVVNITGPISGAGGISKFNVGILKLSGTNTYTGATTVSNGILALGATGSINNSTSINLYPGANGTVFDVSAISAYGIGASTTLFARGTGTGTTTEAAIKGASGGSVNLNSRPINLTYTPTSFTGDTTHPALDITQGTLAVNNNAITVTNNTANALGAGTYRLIQVGNGTTGTIAGVLSSSSLTLAGGGIASNTTAVLAISNGNVNLLVRPVVTFSNFSITQSNTFPVGTTSVTLSGQISGGSLHPGLGENVTVTINGSAQTTKTTDALGDFSYTFNPASVPYSATNYAVALAYAGNNSLSAGTNTTNVAANMLFLDSFLPNNFLGGINLIVTNTSGINMYTWSTTNPGLPVAYWNLESLMQEQPLNDGSGKSRYSINVNPAAFVYYITGPSNAWPYYSPATVQLVTNDFAGDYGFFPTNVSISSAGVLNLPLPPTVVSGPTNLTVLAGKNAAFNVAATGSQPMNFQWLLNTSTPVSGLTTNSSLILTNVSTSQSGMYSVFVTNQYGTTNSTLASLTVLSRPQVAAQVTGGGFQLSGTVVPGETYWVQTTTNISYPPNWKTIATNIADTNGLAQFIDTNGPAQPELFYRLVFP